MKITNIKYLISYSGKYQPNTIWESNNYGKFKILGLTNKRRNKCRHYIIEFCETGTQTEVSSNSINNGTVKDYYCPQKTYFGGYLGTIEGFATKHKLYKRWANMLSRCYDISHDSYKYYGDRGIIVEDELKCFEFYLRHLKQLDNYEKLFVYGYEIDRIDNNENYTVGNIRIVTSSENSRNTRSNKTILMYKEDILIDTGLQCELSERHGVSASVISKILHGKECMIEDYSFEYWATNKAS